MTHVRFKTLGFLTSLALGSALILTGCGLESSATAPETGGVTGQFIRIPEAEHGRLVSNRSLPAPIAEQLISADQGGTMTLGRVTLSFPPGALTEDTVISMALSGPDGTQMELLPHGIQFQHPVTLSVDLTNLVSPTSQWVGVAWWNDQHSRWDEISRHPASNTASALLWHFSQYVAYDAG